MSNRLNWKYNGEHYSYDMAQITELVAQMDKLGLKVQDILLAIEEAEQVNTLPATREELNDEWVKKTMIGMDMDYDSATRSYRVTVYNRATKEPLTRLSIPEHTSGGFFMPPTGSTSTPTTF